MAERLRFTQREGIPLPLEQEIRSVAGRIREGEQLFLFDSRDGVAVAYICPQKVDDEVYWMELREKVGASVGAGEFLQLRVFRPNLLVAQLLADPRFNLNQIDLICYFEEETDKLHILYVNTSLPRNELLPMIYKLFGDTYNNYTIMTLENYRDWLQNSSRQKEELSGDDKSNNKPSEPVIEEPLKKGQKPPCRNSWPEREYLN